MQLYRWSSMLAWVPASSETYIYCSHTLSYSLKRQKEFLCCLVWWKESLEFYKTWCVHKVILKLPCCIVKVCWFFLLFGCWVALNTKVAIFANSWWRAAPYISKCANWFISAVGFNHLWTWNIYAEYGNKLLFLP